MLKLISYKEISKQSDLFFGQFRLRHQEFIERQSYEVKTFEGMEFDEYDTLASVYLVYSLDDKTVLGASRLTPIDMGCMLKDHFPYLVNDPSVFDKPDIWEGTRFCIDRHLDAELRKKICIELVCGYVEFALSRRISYIIGLMPTLILRTVFERSGIVLDRLGAIHQIGSHSKIQAASIAISTAQLERIRDRHSVENVLRIENTQDSVKSVTQNVETLDAA
jgi:N-acyl-L-homoserine lactone synthetase